jgi:hypothetical protein
MTSPQTGTSWKCLLVFIYYLTIRYLKTRKPFDDKVVFLCKRKIIKVKYPLCKTAAHKKYFVKREKKNFHSFFFANKLTMTVAEISSST